MNFTDFAIGAGQGVTQAIDSGSKLYAIKNMQDNMAINTQKANREAQLFEPQLKAANEEAALNATQSALAKINLGKAQEQAKIHMIPNRIPDLFAKYAPNVDPN